MSITRSVVRPVVRSIVRGVTEGIGGSAIPANAIYTRAGSAIVDRANSYVVTR